ncbi:MAG: D-alanyl-D-alanine carboxypeptidase [Candidatus Vogelbacteria bacterium]|nr:D-alanyl-D-alanine carboxypeptidase [Candidatus Vogelbacteria bacterium]
MKQIIQNHKTKIIIILPIVLIFLLTVVSIYVLRLSNPVTVSKPDDKELRALNSFGEVNLNAQSFVVYNDSQKKVIISKNENSQLPLASLTKIMSALVALKLAPRDTIIEAQASDGLVHKWRLDDLLRITLVTSSNSDIETIAKSLSGVIASTGINSDFVGLMNHEARELDLRQTFFLNESGLDINTNLSGAYGSARDVALLLGNAIHVAPDIFETTKFNSITVKSTDGISEYANNTNQTVSNIHGIIASKTGLTDLAGGNLAVAFEVDPNNRIIIVVLGSTQNGRFTDVEALTNATLTYYSKL